MIDIIVPVLNRPERIQSLLHNIQDTTSVPYLLTFVVSLDDHATLHAMRAAEHRYSYFHVTWTAGRGDYARKINHAYRLTSEPYLLLGADDLHFHPGWDTAALHAADATGAGVIGTNDLANPKVKAGKHATHPLVRRDYIATAGGSFTDGPGIVYHEGYDHQGVDAELVTAALIRGQWTFAADSIVEHRHPIFNRDIPMDATYEKALRNGQADIRLYKRRERDFLRKERHGRQPA